MKDAKNELELTSEQKALIEAQDMSAWGPAPISNKDITIPYLLLMQPGSDLVTEGGAAFGEFRDSLTQRKIGSMKDSFEVVPVCMRKVFVEYDISTDPENKKYLRNYPITPQNENLPYKDTEKNAEGKTIEVSRDYVMQFFVLLVEELKNGGELPYILSFRRKGLRNGKKLATQMYVTNRGAKLPPPGRIIPVYAKKESNDKGTWATPDVILEPAQTRITPDEYLVKALEWFKLINSGVAKTDDSALGKEEVTATEPVDVTPSGANIEKGPDKF